MRDGRCMQFVVMVTCLLPGIRSLSGWTGLLVQCFGCVRFPADVPPTRTLPVWRPRLFGGGAHQSWYETAVSRRRCQRPGPSLAKTTEPKNSAASARLCSSSGGFWDADR